MKRLFSYCAVAFAIAVVSSCGSIPTSTGASSNSASTGANQSASSLLGNLVGGAVSNSSTSNSDSGSLIGGIIGQLVGGLVAPTTIEGTWVYSEPTIQFESESLLAKAGGSMATSAIISKIKPYYEKIGITKGIFSITFSADNTCKYYLNGNSYNGSYVYDSQKNTLEVKSNMGYTLATAYVTVSSNSLAITFDTTKLLTLFQQFGATSTNSTISSLSSLSASFNGMKTGFLFEKE